MLNLKIDSKEIDKIGDSKGGKDFRIKNLVILMTLDFQIKK